MVIEPDQPVAKAAQDALHEAGIEAELHTTANGVVEQARQNRPKAIVLSVELPKQSGWSVCAKLKKAKDIRHIPLVMTSSEAKPITFEHHQKLLSRAEEYLQKPYEPSALVALLQPYMSKSDEELIAARDALQAETKKKAWSASTILSLLGFTGLLV